MEWSAQVARAREQWLVLLEQDPDQAIEALAGMSVHARSRARALTTLAERHAVGGGQMVDSGLQAFQENQQGSYTEITSFELGPRVPQAPLGSPPAKSPTVPTPGVSGQPKAAQPKDPPPRNSQLGASAPGTQDSLGTRNSSSTPTSSGQQDPWHGWHRGLLGQDGSRVEGRAAASGTQAPGPSVYNSSEQASAKARGLQPGTRAMPQTQSATSERRTPPAPNSEQQLMPNMSAVPSTSWGRDISFCHGAPVALLDVVGLDGDLPPMEAYRCFRPLRRSRPRTIAAPLARRGFSLNGFFQL